MTPHCLNVDPLEAAKAQIELFQTYFRTKIHAMSSHMPMRSGKTFSIPGVIDTYDPMYLTEMKYISDSPQASREGVVTENQATGNHIHLLTHDLSGTPSAGTGLRCFLLKSTTSYSAHGNGRKISSTCIAKACIYEPEKISSSRNAI